MTGTRFHTKWEKYIFPRSITTTRSDLVKNYHKDISYNSLLESAFKDYLEKRKFNYSIRNSYREKSFYYLYWNKKMLKYL